MAPRFGPALVVGGTGFLGYHLVDRLLKDADFGPIYVLDRNLTPSQLHEKATYFQGSITDPARTQLVLEQTKACVIFHAASPNATYPPYGEQDFFDTNVKGTEILLQLAREAVSVKAFVFTSSIDVYASPAPHQNVLENGLLYADLPPSQVSRAPKYHISKAIADQLVLAANNPGQLLTVSLRDAHYYGERDSQGLPASLDAMNGNWRFQIGDGRNLLEVLSIQNSSAAHLAAAKALFNPAASAGGRVDGEAFNISDGKAVRFWYHIQRIWGFGGDDSNTKIRTIVIPAWFVQFAVLLLEYLFWMFTLGHKGLPGTITSISLPFLIMDHTYSIQKARERLLEYKPAGDHDEVLKQAVDWELAKRREKPGQTTKAR